MENVEENECRKIGVYEGRMKWEMKWEMKKNPISHLSSLSYSPGMFGSSMLRLMKKAIRVKTE